MDLYDWVVKVENEIAELNNNLLNANDAMLSIINDNWNEHARDLSEIGRVA